MFYYCVDILYWASDYLYANTFINSRTQEVLIIIMHYT